MKYLNKLLLFIVICSSNIVIAQKSNPYLIVGTYNSAKSDGIYVYQFNDKTGDVKPVCNEKTSNASYLTIAPSGNFIFAVNENANDKNTGGAVSAFSFDKQQGKLKFINSTSTLGNDPCYIDIDQSGEWLAVANYSGGSLSVLPVSQNGTVGNVVAQAQHYGKGINLSRQEKPHVHCSVFSKGDWFIAVADLGIDQFVLYPFDKSTGKIDEKNAIVTKTTAGVGPRHIVFHPKNNYLYLVEELTGSVSVYLFENNTIRFIQRNEMLLSNQHEGNTGADIHISDDGKFLYASVRGNINEIRIFKINKTGALTAIGKQDTKGINPRNFTIAPSGKYLLVGNQSSDNFVVFKRNKKTGLFTDINKVIALGKPVCLKWIY